MSLNLLLAAKQLICIFLFFFSVNPCTIFNDPCRPCLSYLQIYSCLHLSVYECICIKINTKFAKLGHKNVICDRIRFTSPYLLTLNGINQELLPSYLVFPLKQKKKEVAVKKSSTPAVLIGIINMADCS